MTERGGLAVHSMEDAVHVDGVGERTLRFVVPSEDEASEGVVRGEDAR